MRIFTLIFIFHLLLPILNIFLIVLLYNPDGRISVAAVVKLDLHVGIDVLAKLSTKVDSFKEKAGFSISQKEPLPIPELYKEPEAVKCIQCWVNEEMPSLPPTWNYFLQILRELKLGDVASKIDDYLQSTGQMQQPEPNRDSELCMLLYACQLVCVLVDQLNAKHS